MANTPHNLLDALKRVVQKRRPKTGPVASLHSEKQKKFLRALGAQRMIPTPTQFAQLPKLLNQKERILFWTANIVGAVSLMTLLVWGYTSHLVLLPAPGGSYTEGLVGSPQFINPIYASANDVDQDLVRLVYSGLMRWDPNAGLIPDLAASYTISEDERVYTFSLRDDATWHDGTHVTPRDVIFTFHTLQNPEYGSPLVSAFRGASVEQVDDRTISFTLDEPFAPFLSTLTIGLLPADYWGDIDPTSMRLAERNLIPIGSGPYAFKELEKSKQGAIQSYTLKRWPRYYGGEPHVDTLTFKFYADAYSAAAALKEKRIEGLAFAAASEAEELASASGVTIVSPRLPQITALFFNLDRPAVQNKALRTALGQAINKSMLVDDILSGHGAITHGPIVDSYTNESETYANPTPFDPAASGAALDGLGWTIPEGGELRQKGEGEDRQTLSLTITTVDQSETLAVANAIADMWRQIGIDASVNAVSPSLFRDDTLRDRDYDILLSGILMGADPDPYPFWHSSQQEAPGLNLSQFADRTADSLIEKARATSDTAARIETYEAFTEQLNTTLPAIFLYQPTYSYVTSSRIRGINLSSIVVPSDRFGQVHEWYMRTRKTFTLRPQER